MMTTGSERLPKIVLDTSAYARLRAGHDRVLDAVASADIVWVPAVVVGELEAGFALGSRLRENRVVLQEFLSEPFVVLRPVTESVARRYGEIYAQLRRDGRPIPINDVWIAATTLDCGGELLTFDRHFAQIGGLAATILGT